MEKNLHRLMLSMTESTTKALRNNPSRENMPVSMPKKKQAAKAMTLSLTKRALPMSEMLVYFFKIMATMSVPPEEAL